MSGCEQPNHPLMTPVTFVLPAALSVSVPILVDHTFETVDAFGSSASVDIPSPPPRALLETV